MKRVIGTSLVVLLMVLGSSAVAAPGTAAKTAPAAKSGSATRPAAKDARGGGPRKLEDIHIEGEIPVPQVLFITARDQRRFLDFHHRRYLRTSRELGEATTLPSRVVLVHAPSSGASEAAK